MASLNIPDGIPDYVTDAIQRYGKSLQPLMSQKQIGTFILMAWYNENAAMLYERGIVDDIHAPGPVVFPWQVT